MIVAGITALFLLIRKEMALCPGNFQKIFLFFRFRYTVFHYPGQITGSRGMYPGISPAVRHCGIQPIGGNKKSIKAADIFRLPIHKPCETFHAPPDMPRNGYRRIIMGFQHQRIQQIPQPELLPFPHAQVHLGLPCRIGRNRYYVFHVPVFQRQNTRHNFGCTGHGHLLFFIFPK